jgi:single-stranded-DNA-specific exonuclease
VGLRKLVEKTGIDPDHITAYHVGFVSGPCINAGGRLETARLALELFLSEDPEEADRMAQNLRDLNDKRKDMTETAVREAKAQVDAAYADDSVLVVYLPECHESLAGIIAGRLREFYQKPSIVLTDGAESVKGSGRSIDNYHMFRKLSEVSDLLLKFGGHPMAAGLSLKKENVDAFRRRLNENAGLTEDDFRAKVWIDVPMPLGYVTEKLVREMKLLEPYGQGNEKPQFAEKGLYIRSCRVMGRKLEDVILNELAAKYQKKMIGEFVPTAKNAPVRELFDRLGFTSISDDNGHKVYELDGTGYQKKEFSSYKEIRFED